MKKRLAALLIASLASSALVLTSAAMPVKNPDTFTYASISDVDSLDPAWAYDSASGDILLNVYETLFMWDRGSTVKMLPLMATKLPSRENGLISADGKTYTIPVRKGVKFHDGTPMTVADVRYSLLRFMLQDRVGGPSSLLLEPLVGYPSTRGPDSKVLPNVWADASRAVTVKGDAVVLTLPRPFAPLLTILASFAPVVSREWATRNGDWDGTEATWLKFNSPIKQTSPFYERVNGTGPFKLARWDKKTLEIQMVRNDGYWRAPAKLKHVRIKGINEFGTRKLMLQAGDADSILADRSVITQVSDIPGVSIIDDLPTLQTNPMVLFTYKINMTANPFSGSGKLDGNGIPPDFFADKDVRKAFAYAFDYQAYIKDYLRGKGRQAIGIIPGALPGYDPKGRVRVFDMAKAEEHMKKAHGGKIWEKGFKMTLAYNTGNQPRQMLCQILKRNLEKLNPKFQLDVRAIEWPTFLDASNSSKLPLFVMGWSADYPDAHNFAFPILHSAGTFPSRQGFKYPEMDALIEQAVTETNSAKRLSLYSRLQDLAFEEVPGFAIVESVVYRTQRDWVKGWYHNPILGSSPYGSYFYTISK